MALGMAIGLGLSAATSAYGMYKGHQQKKEGEDALSKLRRPTTQIPQELLDSLSEAERMQVEGLPAAQKAEFVKNLERSRQNTMRGLADRKAGLMGLQQQTQQETDAYSNLTSMDAAARKQNQMQKQSRIEAARANLIAAKQRNEDINMQNYQQDVASAQGMIGAGEQNFMQGLQGIGSAAMSAGMMSGGGGGGESPEAGGGNYRDYKQSGGGMSRREWRNI